MQPNPNKFLLKKILPSSFFPPSQLPFNIKYMHKTHFCIKHIFEQEIIIFSRPTYPLFFGSLQETINFISTLSLIVNSIFLKGNCYHCEGILFSIYLQRVGVFSRRLIDFPYWENVFRSKKARINSTTMYHTCQSRVG